MAEGAVAQGQTDEGPAREALDVERLLANLDENAPWVPGWWFVDTVSSDTVVAPAEGLARRATFPSGPPLDIRVGSIGGIALVGTQRLALFAEARSEFVLGAFAQKPVSQALAHDRKFEPTRSRQRLTLRKGAFALRWASPLATSELTIDLPGAVLRSNAAKFTIVLREDQSWLLVEEGTALIELSATGERLVIADGRLLDLQRSQEGRLVDAVSPPTAQQQRRAERLGRSAELAQSRTWFWQERDGGWRGRVMYGRRDLD